MKNTLILLAIIGLCTGCATMDIGSQADPNTNFSNYQTYAWLHRDRASHKNDSRFNNEIIEGEIMEYSCQTLDRRGLKLDTLKADLLLDYNIATTEKVKQVEEPVYGSYYPRRRYYYNPYSTGGWMYYPYYTGPTTYISGYRTVDVPYKEGTIIIYAIDAKTNKMVWQGWAEGEVENASSFQKSLKKNVKAILKKFPK